MNSLSETFNPKLIVKSWVDSLKIFIPANFKLFALVTLKSFIDGAKVFFVKVFWLWALVLFGGTFLISYMLPWLSNIAAVHPNYLMVINIVVLLPVILGRLIFEFGCILSIRSSVDKKDISYFKKYLRSFPAMLALWFGFTWCASYAPQFGNNIYLIVGFSMLYWILMQITLFFFVESGRTVKEIFQSLWRMFIFFIFNLPGLAVFSCMAILIIFSSTYIRQVHWVVWFILESFVYMISICVLYNYFIKRFHDHSELYF